MKTQQLKLSQLRGELDSIKKRVNMGLLGPDEAEQRVNQIQNEATEISNQAMSIMATHMKREAGSRLLVFLGGFLFGSVVTPTAILIVLELTK